MIQRIGWYSVGISAFLLILNLTISWASGSLALMAEVVHNLGDLMAAAAVLAGLKLSEHRRADFPYGLYKVENVVTVGIALLIFMSGYEIARQAVSWAPRQTIVATWMIAGVLVAMFVPLAFSRFELRIARRVNSPSLAADAQEYRMHVFSSGVVLVALLGAWSGIPLDRAAAVIVVGIVFKTGWTLLRDGMRMLLDASLDDDTLAAVRAIIEAEPAVVSIKALRGRSAGRFRFLEAEIGLRITDLERANQIGQSLEQAVRTEVPHVERVSMHLEPAQKPVLRVAVSLSGAEGPVSLHFGTAPYFALADIRPQDGVCLRQDIVSNPYHLEAARRGLDVAKWLVAEEVDVVITGDDVRDKTPGYVLSNAGVKVVVTRAADLTAALDEWLTDRDIIRSAETLPASCAE